MLISGYTLFSSVLSGVLLQKSDTNLSQIKYSTNIEPSVSGMSSHDV
jgi:hypothetical protein